MLPDGALAPLSDPSDTFDPVSRPQHYVGDGGLEARDVIRDWCLGFELGNAVKYVLRAGRKHPGRLQDLRKASQYLLFVAEDLDAGGSLAEWTADHASTVRPAIVVQAFQLPANLAAVIVAIYDIAMGPTFSLTWLATARRALEREIAIAADAEVAP